MKKINNIRGMYDIFGEEFSNQDAIKKKFGEIMGISLSDIFEVLKTMR